MRKPRTINEGGNDELAVLFHQVIDVAENATVAEKDKVSR